MNYYDSVFKPSFTLVPTTPPLDLNKFWQKPAPTHAPFQSFNHTPSYTKPAVTPLPTSVIPAAGFGLSHPQQSNYPSAPVSTPKPIEMTRQGAVRSTPANGICHSSSGKTGLDLVGLGAPKTPDPLVPKHVALGAAEGAWWGAMSSAPASVTGFLRGAAMGALEGGIASAISGQSGPLAQSILDNK
jgi:hypothetical protein